MSDDTNELRRQVAEALVWEKQCLVSAFFRRYPSARPELLRLVTMVEGSSRITYKLEYRGKLPKRNAGTTKRSTSNGKSTRRRKSPQAA